MDQLDRAVGQRNNGSASQLLIVMQCCCRETAATVAPVIRGSNGGPVELVDAREMAAGLDTGNFLGPFAATCILDDRLLSGAIATNLMSGQAAPGLTRPPRHASRPPLERTPQAAHTVTARAGKSVVSVRRVCGR